jgi:hypothetical protein
MFAFKSCLILNHVCFFITLASIENCLLSLLYTRSRFIFSFLTLLTLYSSLPYFLSFPCQRLSSVA